VILTVAYLAGIELKQIMTTGYPPLNEMTEGKQTISFFLSIKREHK